MYRPKLKIAWHKGISLNSYENMGHSVRSFLYSGQAYIPFIGQIVISSALPTLLNNWIRPKCSWIICRIWPNCGEWRITLDLKQKELRFLSIVLPLSCFWDIWRNKVHIGINAQSNKWRYSCCLDRNNSDRWNCRASLNTVENLQKRFEVTFLVSYPKLPIWMPINL